MITSIVHTSLRYVAAWAPTNAMRASGLRAMGHRVGCDTQLGIGLLTVDDASGEVARLVIGDRAALGPRVTVMLSSHPNQSRLRSVVGECRGTVRIGADAWIGAGAIILPGINVGDAAIVGAGAVVTSDVAPRTIVGGVPAKRIREIPELDV